MKPIRILIAEDSPMFAEMLVSTLEAEPDMTVIGVAENGVVAVERTRAENPDIVLMDIQMPELDGLSATESIMADSPTPILVVTADPYRGGVDLSFAALSAGALDLVPKPRSLPWPEADRDAFLRKVRLLAQVAVVRHQRAARGRIAELEDQPAGLAERSGHVVVGLVASTGGPRALARILGELPAGFPAPILVVQHIMPGFSGHLASWLDANSELRVVEARAGTAATPGNVFIAPPGQHLALEASHELRLRRSAAIGGHRPSGDVLLESIARESPGRAIGVVLSGMGSDGTSGLAAIHRTGGVTLVQDRESSVVYGMPQSALDLGVVNDVVELGDLSRRLVAEVERLNRGGE